MRRHHIVGEVTVDRRAAARVIAGVFEQRHADAHHQGALDLVAAGAGVDDAPTVDHRDDPVHAQARNFRLPADFDELRAE